MQLINWNNLNDQERKETLSRTAIQNDDNILKTVNEIIENVRENGDEALKDYANKFDKVSLENFQVSQDEFAETKNIDIKVKEAIKVAYENIKAFHELQLPQKKKLNRNGIKLWYEYRPIEKVGLYVPGGTAPLISTLLMLAIPAKLASCPEIIVTTPCGKNGKVPIEILYIAELCGIKTVYKAGGAGAVAAMAFGTESIKKVDKIFGPGNKYVTLAKQLVSNYPNGAALDMPAGPSEVLVIADKNANPIFVASDLLAQAEHDTDAGVVLVTDSLPFARRVLEETEKQLQELPRKDIAKVSLGNGKAIIVDNLEQAIEIANEYAPEHLMLEVDNSQKYLKEIKNAGSVFIGNFSSEALGDYASGTNHVLPTYGYAKTYSGINVLSFMKAISFQDVSEDGLSNIANVVELLADLEGLEAHKMSVVRRRS